LVASSLVGDEFQVEVELDDDAHGYPLRERLRARDLDDEARRRLGRDIMVTRDGSRIFLYTGTEEQAREAERTVRELVEADELTADIAVTRWHPVEEAWKDAALPLPATPDEERAEYAAREAAEAEEASAQHEYDWHVLVRLPRRDDARTLAERLVGEGLPVARRWRYVVVGALTEERAEEIADRLRAEAPEADVSVEVNLNELRLPQFLFLPF
jgi:hypothetical protein